MDIESLSSSNFYTWVKDIKFNYLDCNESVTKLSDLESPHQIKNKTDFKLPWKKQANLINKVDFLVLNNKVNYTNYIEILDIRDKKVALLVTKSPLLNKQKKCIGIIGHAIETNSNLMKEDKNLLSSNENFYLGEKFNNEYLTKRELEVFRYILSGYSAKKIALHLKLSARTIEEYTDNLKRKLQCSSKYEIISVAIKYGLTHL